MPQKIVKARITAMPQTLLDPMPEVWVTLEGGKEEKLFEYYPDELHFSESEFVGLTVQEGHQLKTARDIAFLKSQSYE